MLDKSKRNVQPFPRRNCNVEKRMDNLLLLLAAIAGILGAFLLLLIPVTWLERHRARRAAR